MSTGIGECPGGTESLPETWPRSSQQTLFSYLLRPQLGLTQGTFGWKTGHLAMTGRLSFWGGRNVHSGSGF